MKVMDKIRKIDWIQVILWIWVFCASVYVVYRMTISGSQYFISDYPAHIQFALDGEYYSIIGVIIQFLYGITGNTKLIALFMGFIIAMTCVGIRYMLTTLIRPDGNKSDVGCTALRRNVLTFFSYGAVFISALNIPGKAPFYMLTDLNGSTVWDGAISFGTFLSQPWHNSTYTGMRFLAIPTIAIFVRLWKKKDKILIREYLLLFVLLTLTNLNKPNFIIAFAPAVLIFCIWDLIAWKEHKLTDYIGIAISFVLSMIVLFFQYKVLYQSDGDNSVIINPVRLVTYFKDGYLWFALLANYTFPFIVTIISLICKRKNKTLLLAWLFNLVTFIEWMFLEELGSRASHGNFGWNMPLAGLTLFIVCFAELVELYKTDTKYKWILNIATGILAIHFINGFMYFGIVYNGGMYQC